MVFDHHALVTDRDGDTLALEAHHRAHARVELVIRDLKDGPLAHLPSGKFTANAAWLGLAVLAHNLGRHTLTAAGADWSAATVGSLRRKLLTMPARLVSSARRLRLRASANWPWADALTSALTAIRGDPRARLTGSPPPRVRHDPTHTAPEPLRPRSAAPRQPSTPRNTQNPQDPPNTIATTSTQRRPPKLAPSGLRCARSICFEICLSTSRDG